MLHNRRWRIFYADRSEFGHEQGSHDEAPTHGVIAVVQDVPGHGVQVLLQSDLYWWRDDMWWAGDALGFVDQAGRFGASWVKQGQSVKPLDYADILGAAITLKAEWDKCPA